MIIATALILGVMGLGSLINPASQVIPGEPTAFGNNCFVFKSVSSGSVGSAQLWRRSPTQASWTLISTCPGQCSTMPPGGIYGGGLYSVLAYAKPGGGVGPKEIWSLKPISPAGVWKKASAPVSEPASNLSMAAGGCFYYIGVDKKLYEYSVANDKHTVITATPALPLALGVSTPCIFGAGGSTVQSMAVLASNGDLVVVEKGTIGTWTSKNLGHVPNAPNVSMGGSMGKLGKVFCVNSNGDLIQYAFPWSGPFTHPRDPVIVNAGEYPLGVPAARSDGDLFVRSDAGRVLRLQFDSGTGQWKKILVYFTFPTVSGQTNAVDSEISVPWTPTGSSYIFFRDGTQSIGAISVPGGVWTDMGKP